MGRYVSLLTRYSWTLYDASMLVTGRLLEPPRVLPGRAWLETATRIAAVYHDLGKAAESFQKHFSAAR